MKKHYLAIIFALTLTSACTVNVGTGNSNTTAPTSNANTANATNSAPSNANSTANTATAPKKEEADATKKAEPTETKSAGERIQFAKGETSTSVTKDIPANGSVDFLINVKKGQKMGFTVGYDFKDSDVNYALYEPDTKNVTMSAGPKEPQEFEVKMNGDHRLAVNNTTNKKITITLYLDVE